MSEAAPEASVMRLGPLVTNLIRSIWRQRWLVLLGLAVGIALGLLALPRVLGNGSKYQATVRLVVQQSAVDAVLAQSPIPAGADQTGGEADLIKDTKVAQLALQQLGRAGKGLNSVTLLDGLTVTPVASTIYVDLSYTASDPDLARDVVQAYAQVYAETRNANEAKRLSTAIDGLNKQADQLRVELHTAAAEDRPSLQARYDGVVKQADDLQSKNVILGAPTSVYALPVVTRTGAPVSRNIAVALGVLIGLALGAGGGLLLETTTPKVISESDAEEASGLPFIATVRKAGMRRSSLPVVDRPFTPAAEDYRRVGTALERQGLGGDVKVLAITSADPREGKSSLAANLAHVLTRQGRNVLLVSSDLRRPHVEKLLGMQPRAGLAEALQDDTANVLALLVSINQHLLVLPAGLPTRHPGELLASSRLDEIIDALRQMDAIVLLDTPPARWSADAMALAGVADATLLVVRSGMTRWRNLREATNGLRRDRLRQLGVVLVGTGGAVGHPLTLRYSTHQELAAESLPITDDGNSPPPPATPRAVTPLSGSSPNGGGPGAERKGIVGVTPNPPHERDRKAAE